MTGPVAAPKRRRRGSTVDALSGLCVTSESHRCQFLMQIYKVQNRKRAFVGGFFLPGVDIRILLWSLGENEGLIQDPGVE